MKIKLDFVSNSSSTSFLFIKKSSEFSLQSFLDAAGISKDSPLLELFENFYDTINTAIRYGNEIHSYDELDTFLERTDMDDKSLLKIKDAIKNNIPVISAKFSTDGGNAYEAFLCLESFEIDCEEFLLSAYEDIF